MIVTFHPADPAVADLFRLEVHEAAFDALVEAGAIRDGYLEAPRLEAWADGCEHPEGQRAALARAIAQLCRVSPLTVGRSD